MNPDSEHNNLDSTSPHHKSGDDNPSAPIYSDAVDLAGDVQEQDSDIAPIVAEIVSAEPQNDEQPSRIPVANQRAATMAAETGAQQTILHQSFFTQPSPIAKELSNISANGGAVGAVVLGFWSILCSLITPFSVVNALLALLLGAYGLTSQKRKLAIAGMILGIIGGAMSLIETNEILNDYFAEEAAS